eukprot:Ihof_evm8s154 gene=Ihof_evmTU8s154
MASSCPVTAGSPTCLLPPSLTSSGERIHCDSCKKDITSEIHIHCAVCTDVDLCLDCFSRGKQAGSHRNDHAYRITDNAKYPLFDAKWGADEELLLLEAIEMYGFGNWTDISDHVGTKTTQDCEQHYFNTYINVPTAPLPDMSTQIEPWDGDEPSNGGPFNDSTKKGDSTNGDEANRHAVTLNDAAGYMPLRGDFDVEPYNEAEDLIKDIVFQSDDTDLDKELKLTMIHIYNRVLCLRDAYKKVVLDYNLLDINRVKALDRRRSKEDKETKDRLRPLARLHSPEEHEEFIQGLIMEQRLRSRIRQLQNQRMNGIKDLQEGEIYEAEKRKRDTEKCLKKARKGSSYLYNNVQAGGRRQSAYITKRNAEEGDVVALESSPVAKRRITTPLNLDSAEGVELLTAAEKTLCSHIRIYPVQYISIKANLIKEYTEVGYLKLAQARVLARIDVNKTRRIYDHLVMAGVVTKDPVTK